MRPLDSVPWYGPYIGAATRSRRRDMGQANDRAGAAKKAVIHRMVMPNHVCPYGIKAKHLLERAGYEVEDRHLATREETDAFKEAHGVEATPQIFIGGERIGG